MKKYRYLKAPKSLLKKPFFKARVALSLFMASRFKKILFVLMVPAGFILLGSVVYSAFSYKLLVFKRSQQDIVAPISKLSIAEAKGLMNPLVAGVFTQENLVQQGDEIDYSLINNWFPSVAVPKLKDSKITHYNLSIPKLKINNAVVTIGGTKVENSLVQYPGTALPGEYGNTVVFGHSVLPMFYNPKDYKTIFSLLPTLKEGDTIYLYYDGIEYLYKVYDYYEVKPEEVDVLKQQFDKQILTLITCVPPGTYLKRGILKARLTR